MKKLFFAVVIAAFAAVGCSKIQDIPHVQFERSSYTVSGAGGKFVIPVHSTGVDDVIVEYDSYYDRWEVDTQTGDLTPKEGWVELLRVIDRYDTRALASWRSGLEIEVEENGSIYERKAYITVQSFQAAKKVTILQPGRDALIVRRGGEVVYTDNEPVWAFISNDMDIEHPYDLCMDGTRFMEGMPLLDMQVYGMNNMHSDPKNHFYYEAESVVPYIRGNAMPNYTLTDFRCEMENWTVLKVSFTCMGCDVTYVKNLIEKH